MENIQTLEEAKHFVEKSQQALKYYENHLKSVKKYQKANPEKMCIKAKKQYQKIKSNDPDKYNEYLIKQRKYYEEVAKPRNPAKQTAC